MMESMAGSDLVAATSYYPVCPVRIFFSAVFLTFLLLSLLVFTNAPGPDQPDELNFKVSQLFDFFLLARSSSTARLVDWFVCSLLLFCISLFIEETFHCSLFSRRGNVVGRKVYVYMNMM